MGHTGEFFIPRSQEESIECGDSSWFLGEIFMGRSEKKKEWQREEAPGKGLTSSTLKEIQENFCGPKRLSEQPPQRKTFRGRKESSHPRYADRT